MRKAHYRNEFLRQLRVQYVESTLRVLSAQLIATQPKRTYYYPESGCYCAATHAPCSWCTDPSRVEEDFARLRGE